jgi:hypothetical protein
MLPPPPLLLLLLLLLHLHCALSPPLPNSRSSYCNTHVIPWIFPCHPSPKTTRSAAVQPAELAAV